MTKPLKPENPTIICPFTVVIDTREQAPWRFTGIRDDETGDNIVVPLQTTESLKSGDYSIVGYENRIAIERKSLADFYGSIGRERERFEREIERLNEMDHAFVVIEESWNSILYNPPSQTQVSPKVAHSTIISWSLRYPKVHWIEAMNRRHAEVFTFRTLAMYWRQEQHRVKAARMAETTKTGDAK